MEPKKPILIVEDNADDRRLLEHSLRKVGVHQPIAMARSGGEAVKYLAATQPFGEKNEAELPGAIFLDLDLPDMSGYEVLKWIACQPPMRRVLVVVHSGLESTKEIEALYAAGANTFLRKSTDRSELQNLVDSFPVHFDRSRTEQRGT
jgi:CheY-like chemotaxis protein